ncbi:hypothetical protein V5O48_011064 [Marasmius crinis-equi]|uniref:Uncharacterized protein n=1 Tax=Marasmius crinis-equi TaxID=585013 RepID=A0ABR3F728_9AGAR
MGRSPSVSSTSSYCSSSSESATSIPDLRHGTPPLDPNRLGVDIEALKRLPQPPYRDPFNHNPTPVASSSTREPSPMLWYNSPLLNSEGSIMDDEPISQNAGSVASAAAPESKGQENSRRILKSKARKASEPYPTTSSDGSIDASSSPLRTRKKGLRSSSSLSTKGPSDACSSGRRLRGRGPGLVKKAQK